ncbi:MAG: hypothetical protein JST19_08135 [Bacteroidetes bacterium]|nr:hypothetical protein [Bacteroidota bacterium]
MARAIRSLADVQRTPTVNTTVDDYKDRLVKLIPSEIVTAYITILGLINGADANGNKPTLLWIVFILLTVLTPFYLYFFSKVTKIAQLVFTTIAFVIWVIVAGSPFPTLLGFSASFIGSIILIVYTLFIPFVYQG